MSAKYTVKQSVLNSIFYLNNSYSKFLTVGLQESEQSEDYNIVIGLGGSQNVLSFTVEEWSCLQDSFCDILDFLEQADNVRWRKPIYVSDKINLTFTQSFNSKSVIIEKLDEDYDASKSGGNDDEPPKKKVPAVYTKLNF